MTFKSEQGDEMVVFTTRPDTLWGATFMVLAPEHPLVDKLTPESHRERVKAYQAQTGMQTEIERTTAEREKTGVVTGAYAINPVNGKRIPIWIADYVMMSYGTGAIMGVPAHDERDFAFAHEVRAADHPGDRAERRPGEERGVERLGRRAISAARCDRGTSALEPLDDPGPRRFRRRRAGGRGAGRGLSATCCSST